MAAKAEFSRCGYVLGDDGLTRWSDLNSEAWLGLLETHKRLTRALDAELEAEHGLTLSTLEVLGRLAAAEARSLGLTALAETCGLSLSRISRIMDVLATRGLVVRRAALEDARAVVAQLTDEGLALARRAQCSHFAAVQRRFFERLSDDEIAALAEIFAKFVTSSETAACQAGRAVRQPA